MITPVNSTYGLGIPFYDQIAAEVTGFHKATPGFRMHSADAPDGGVVVTEIWDNGQDQRAFFESAVKPRIPARGTVRDSGGTGQYHRRVRRPPCAPRRQRGECHE